MIKVAHVFTIYAGAVGILEPKLLALSACDDLDVTVLTGPRPRDMDLPDARVRQLSFAIVRPIRPLADSRSIWSLYRLLRRERFDVVHTHSAKAGMIGALAAWLARVPLVLHTYHGLPFYDGQARLPYLVYYGLERFACRFRHHVFSQNRRDLPVCVKLTGRAERVSFEGNGVDAEAVRRAATESRQQAEGDFPGGGIRLAMVSRLEPVKRVSDFLRACELLAARGLDICGVVAGTGPLDAQLRQEVQQRGLSERVRLLGWSRRVPALLAAADVVVLTSEKEGIPRSLMEAMALGRPVVATDVLGTQELVVDGETGFLTPMGDPAALAEKICELAGDPELRRTLGRAGMRRVEAEFNDLKIAAFLRRFYSERAPGRCAAWPRKAGAAAPPESGDRR